MLRIYPICLDMVRRMQPYIKKVGMHDQDLARQLKRACVAVPLNMAEGSRSRAGKRRHCYDIANGEAQETLVGLEVAQAAGYIDGIDDILRGELNQIIGTLVNCVR